MQEYQTQKKQEEKSDSTSSTEKTYKPLSGNIEPEIETSNIKTPYGDQLRLENGTEKKEGKLLEAPIAGTPFQMVETEEGQYFIGMKPYVMTKRCKTADAALRELEANRWNIVVNLIYAISDKVYNDNRQQEINFIDEEIKQRQTQEEMRIQEGLQEP